MGQSDNDYLCSEMGKKIETSEERISLLEQQLEDTLELMRKVMGIKVKDLYSYNSIVASG